MRVAFLDPLEARQADFPQRYLGEHQILLTDASGRLPLGVEDAEVVIWWSYPVDRDVIDSRPRLRLMQRIGVTRFKGDASAALARAIPVSVFPFGVSDRVAFHALALTSAVLRKLIPSHLAVRDGVNPDDLPEVETGAPAEVNWSRIADVDTLNDKTVGSAGFGEIGACYARMLQPFNCPLLYYKRHRMTPAHERFFNVEHAGLDDLLRRSNIVTTFVPYTEESRKMLGERELRLLKPAAIFFNAGRGNTVDEAALVSALQERRIAGAGLDVFAVEPVPRTKPYCGMQHRRQPAGVLHVRRGPRHGLAVAGSDHQHRDVRGQHVSDRLPAEAGTSPGDVRDAPRRQPGGQRRPVGGHCPTRPRLLLAAAPA